MSDDKASEIEDSTASASPNLNDVLAVDRKAIEALLYGSEALRSLSYEMIAVAHKKCPDHYNEFLDLHKKHFNANCGPLHMYIRELLDS